MKRVGQPILIATLLGTLAIPGRGVLAEPQPALPPAFAVGTNPVSVAVDDATHTAYVTNPGDDTVSVVDTSVCHGGMTSGCNQNWLTIPVGKGKGPLNAAINGTTDTVYVADIASNTVSVIDGATCNASTHTGCSTVPPVVQVGVSPRTIAIDESTNTIYVDNNNNGRPGTVSVIDGSHCDAADTSGCSGALATVTVGTNPIGLAFDPVNNTVYVANAAQNGPNTLSMIDASSCNATARAGCARTPPTVTVAKNVFNVDIDLSTDTVYVAGWSPVRGYVSVIDGASCNAHITAGCGNPQPAVKVGSDNIGIVVDQATHNVFVPNQGDSTVSVVDGSSCNARIARGCDQSAPTGGVGFNPGRVGHDALDPATGTLYVASQNENKVYVLDVDACTLTHPAGCRRAAPTTTVGSEPQGIAIDHATGTIYVGDRSDNQLSVINGAICNGNRLSGCDTAWPTVAAGPAPQAIAIDEATRTLYTANNSGTVSVLDISHCNTSDLSGCARAPGTVTISTKSDPLRSITVDDAVHTVYVTDGNGNRLAMINNMSCNGTASFGCGTAPATVAVGTFPDGLVIDPRTQTVYAANWKSANVSVIDATTCNAQVTSGCGGSRPTISVGKRPNLMAFNPATNTLYVANADSGTVSVLDATTCNAKDSSGCGQTAATIPVSSPDVAQGTPSPFAVGVDEARDVLYIADIVHSTLTVVDGATCNGKISSGCSQPLAIIPVGGWPTGVAIDLSLDAAYVPQNVDGEVSVVRLLHARAGATGDLTRFGSSSQGSFTVWFDSASPGQGYVLFGSGPGCTGLVETATQDQGAGTISHAVTVTGNDLPGTVGDNGIQPDATYWYETVTVTKSGTEIDNNGGKCYSVTVPTM